MNNSKNSRTFANGSKKGNIIVKLYKLDFLEEYCNEFNWGTELVIAENDEDAIEKFDDSGYGQIYDIKVTELDYLNDYRILLEKI